MHALVPYARRPAPVGRPGVPLSVDELRDYVSNELQSLERSAGRYAVQTGEVGVTNTSYQVGDPRRYGARGNGFNDTTAVQNAASSIAAIGGGTVWLFILYTITSQILAGNNTRFFGGGVGGGGLKAHATWTAVNGLIRATGRTAVIVEMCELDGNYAAGARNVYGVFGDNGERFVYKSNYIHDTHNAGICDLDQFYSDLTGNLLLNCGRTGVTDNHGIMLGSIAARGSKGARIVANTIDGAYRKSLTVFAFTPGTTRRTTVNANVALNGGLGGGYFGGDVANIVSELSVAGNTFAGNYTNIEAAYLRNSSFSGNTANGTLGDCNINFSNCTSLTVAGNGFTSAQAQNVKLASCTRLIFSQNLIADANRLGTPGGPSGVHVIDSTYCLFVRNIITDDTPYQQYGILEEGTSDNNIYVDNIITGYTAGEYSIIGASSLVQSTSARKFGVNTTTPANTLDVAGGLTIREQALTLVNGPNNNVTLPTRAGTLYVTGPTAAFSITGIAGGAGGRRLTIVNLTTQVMTVSYNSGSSSAGNRILNGSAADLTVASLGAVEVSYTDFAPSAWIVTSRVT